MQLLFHKDDDLMSGTKGRVLLMRAYYKWFDLKIYDMATARLSMKVRLLKAEVIVTLLHRCDVDPRRDVP